MVMDSLPHITSPQARREQHDMLMDPLRTPTPVQRAPTPVRKEKELPEIPSMIIIMPNSSTSPPAIKEIPEVSRDTDFP